MAHTALEVQPNPSSRSTVLRVWLAAVLAFVSKWISTLAQKINQHGQTRRLTFSHDPTILGRNWPEMLAAGPHTTLTAWLQALEASGGFVAVEKGECLAIVASVNSLPVGHRLELALIPEEQRTVKLHSSFTTACQSREFTASSRTYPDAKFVRLVEQALRALSDYAVLGRSELVNQLTLRPASQIEHAKAMRQILIDAIERLRPCDEVPTRTVPRAWYAYTILHDAYVNDVPNRQIMSKLYISESTFNRQRRNALRAVATTIWESRQSASML
jgi:hypothetical protein